MSETKSKYNLLVVIAAAIGSFTYGYAVSILGNTLSKPDFFIYMNMSLVGPGASYTNSWIGAWNCTLYAGGLLGCCTYPSISSRFGRRLALAVGSATVVLGGALQAGEVHAGMLCVARIVTGLGLGLLLPGAPLYQAEVAPPHARGLMVGVHACFLGGGLSFAQWIGVAFFHVGGQVSWRVPMGLLCIFPLLLLSLLWFLPESPRWLYMMGREEEAEEVLIKLHRDSADPTNSFSRKEFRRMKAQIDLEATANRSAWRFLKDVNLRKRFIVGWLVMTATQSSGSIVILTYSATIYGTLGFSPFLTGVMAGIWTVLLTVGNFAGGILVDKVGRVRQMICGLLGCLLCLVMSAILTALYATSANKAGNNAAVFFVFLFVLFFGAGIEAPAFVYASEVFPGAWRASGVAFSMSAVFFWSTLFTGVAAPAFANIGWKFYLVFASMTAVMAVVAFLLFPETKNYSLEQIGQAFGDETADETVHQDEVDVKSTGGAEEVDMV